jgi:hypothetical protein
MPALIVVDSVKAVPEPLAPVFQPAKLYPVREGLAGKFAAPIVVAGGVTVLVAWTASVPSLLLKVTV